METINEIELADENTFPDETILKAILGSTYDTYLELLALYEKIGLEYKWRYYKDGRAWLCKVTQKRRTIVWMSAWKGYMQATVYFPQKFLNEVYHLEISDSAKEKIRNTKNVGKSKPCIFEIIDRVSLSDLEKIMDLKMRSK